MKQILSKSKGLMQKYNKPTNIWGFKRKILGLILTCKLPGQNNFPLLVDHTRKLIILENV